MQTIMSSKKDTPLVSVIIPLYNGADKIKKCLETLDNQLFDGTFEVIIVDDCSTDQSAERVKESISRLNKHSVFRVVECKENGRAGKARNIGVEKAQGEYILFVDQDDYILQKTISELYRYSEDGKYDLVICNIMEGDHITYKRCQCKEIKELDNEKRRRILHNNFGYVLAILIRKSVIVENHLYFPEKLMFEDALYNLGLLINASSINSTDEVLYFRAGDETSQTGSLSKKKINDRIHAALYYLTIYQNKQKYQEYYDIIIKYAFYYIYLSSMWWIITKPELYDKELFNLSLSEAKKIDYNWSQVFYPSLQEHRGQTLILKCIYYFSGSNVIFRVLAKIAKWIRREKDLIIHHLSCKSNI